MAHEFILIPGRSSRQGVTLNEGKYTDGYLDETSTLRMNPVDMQRLEIAQGEEVRMWNDMGEVVVPCIDAKDECPEGLVFICYGDKSSQLMSGETHGTGMPDSKALDVFIHPAREPRPAANVQEPVTQASTTPAVSQTQSAPVTKPVASAPEPTRQEAATPSVASTRVERTESRTNGIGPTLVMGLFVIALIVLAVVMNLG